MFQWLTDRRRKHLLETPFPDEWRAILEARVAIYGLLDDAEQQRLRDLVQVFVAEKHWEGCGGLELTDDHRLTVAGSACLLLLGRDHDLFTDVESILIYPSTVVIPPRVRGAFEVGAESVVDEVPILGQAFRGGPVILAWDSVVTGAHDAHDGRNVVIHEFAHKIDFLDGAADGTPPLPDRASRRAWAEACEKAFLALKNKVDHHHHGFLRDYAATNEAEFFAVVTEVFFEKPAALHRELPDVYAVVLDFYQLDLAGRTARE
jgi:MtfA peptidase